MRLDPAAVLASPIALSSLSSQSKWRIAAMACLLTLIAISLFYAQTVTSTAAIWIRSETFTHGFFIVPISAYLIWKRRQEVAAIKPSPAFMMLPILALTGFAWLLGVLSGVLFVEQYAFFIMLPLAVWCILGTQVAKALAFPLLFVLFAVPFGEIFLPTLMGYTADFTVFALQLTGIPVYREGLYFTIPSGHWSVVEACSGLRYLIASLTLGCLYAYLTYRSFKRRAVFIALSVIIPIIANGVRAYMIVMIGHLSNMKLATGIDHYIYGWIFFGIVILLLFWIGSFWREDYNEAEAVEKATIKSDWQNPLMLRPIIIAAIATLGIATVWPAYAAYLAKSNVFGQPVLQAPAGNGGWQPAPPLSAWQPHYLNTQARINQTYVKDGHTVGLFIGYYNNQHQGAELITSNNTMVSTTDKFWGKTAEADQVIELGTQKIPAQQTLLRGPHMRLATWNWFWVEGRYTHNPYLAKLLEAKSQLLSQGDDAAVIVVYAPYEDRPEEATRQMQDFLRAILPTLNKSLNDANQG